VAHAALVTSGSIDGHTSNGKAIAAVDADDLYRGVLDRDTGDGRAGKGVCRQELGLSLSSIRTLAIPVEGTLAVKDRSRRALDSDLAATDGKKGPCPLLVAESGGALEDDSGASCELGEIKRGTGWYSEAGKSHGSTGGLCLHGCCSSAST